jgi:hypothetical protein
LFLGGKPPYEADRLVGRVQKQITGIGDGDAAVETGQQRIVS